jgi:uncharacterized RDD family membrane protein YckC
VGWVAPPPEPAATGQPGWVIASVGARFGAYLLDSIIVGAIYAAIILTFVFATRTDLSGDAASTATYLAFMGLFFLYFVGFWTSGSKATPGMRLFKLQIANAADGKRLAIGQAVVRFVALEGPGLLIVIPVLASLGTLSAIIWAIVLLITTMNGAMHQGLHDRWAKSVVVRPDSATSSSGAWFATCLIIILIGGFLILVPIIALIFLGGQLSEILSAVGSSI